MTDNQPLNRALAAAELAKGQRPSTPTGELDKSFLNKTAPAPTFNSLQKSEAILPEPSTPKIVKVDISIAGVPHRINCPSSEVANLNKDADQLNEALREIRRNVRGKSPSNEEILVLHCLDLYDKVRELTKAKEQHTIESQRATALIDKIIKDAVAIL